MPKQSQLPRPDFQADLSLLIGRATQSAFPKSLPLREDEHRLSLASSLVSIVLGLFLAHIYVQNRFPEYQKKLTHLLLKQKMSLSQNKVYPVIIEQQARSPKQNDQYRALAEFDAEGRGGITTEYGFHTLSNTDIFQPGNNHTAAGETSSTQTQATHQATKAANERHQKTGNLEKKETDFLTQQTKKQNRNNARSLNKSQGKGMYLKVPANYRFKQHMALRYDGRSLTAIATERMPGAAYFRGMIRQIRETFAPPGQNYIYRDRFGYMINQTIQPQIVSVQFVINRNGLVTDVKVVSSIGQRKVDQACVEVLRNKNFGRPPPEIFRHGNIFGINFVFPDLRRFR